jgi:hypothetical protein
VTDQPADLELVSERVGKKYRITARVNGGVTYAHVLDPANATHRDKYVRAVHDRCPGVPPDAIEGELLKIAATGAGRRLTRPPQPSRTRSRARRPP